MPDFERYFPGASFVVTGCAGPKSNSHGPNEFLHIPFAKKLIFCLLRVLHERAATGTIEEL